jgi:diguanylate cyclase (GGDEF)-like protein
LSKHYLAQSTRCLRAPLAAILFTLFFAAGPSIAASFDLTERENDYLAALREKPVTLAYSFDLLYTSDENGERGMLMPLVTFMRNRLGIEISPRKIGWDDAFITLADGSADLLGLVGLTEARRLKYITSRSVFRTNAQIVTKLEHPLGSPLSLHNKKIGLLTENIMRDGIESYLYPNGRAVYYGSIDDLLSSLEDGEIDCILALNNTEIEIIENPSARHEFADQNFYTDQCLIATNENLRPLVDILNRFLDSPSGDSLRADIETARIDAIYSAAKKHFSRLIEQARGNYPEVRMIDCGDMYPLSFIEKGRRKGLMPEINEIFEKLTGIPIVIQDIDSVGGSISSTAERIRSGRTHFAMDAHTNAESAHDPILTYSIPLWIDNIRTYSYMDMGDKSLSEVRVGTTQNGLTYINWDIKPANRPKIYNSRSSLLDALKNGKSDVAFMSEMAFNYQYTIMKDYELREFDDTQAVLNVKMMSSTQNAGLNRLYNETILLHQALYPQSRDRWKHASDRYKSDYMRLRESQRGIMQSVFAIVAVMSALILYSFRRLFVYDRQISRMIRKQQTFDLAWGNLRTGRFNSKGNISIFKNWGFKFKEHENTLDGISRVLGMDLRKVYRAEMEYMKKNGIDMTVTQKMLTSPTDDRKMYYRSYLHYLTDHEFMECMQDVTDEINNLDTLSAAVATDFLSKLLTRRAMNDRLLQKCGELMDTGGRAFVIMFDIDDFKKVNDTYGHDAGDEVLKSVASIIKNTVGENGATSRWGGEEFLAMLDCDDIEAAKACAWTIVRAIEASEVKISGTEKIIKTTISAGMAELHPGKHYNVSVRFADKALYDAKRGGKNTVRVWNTHLKQSV